MAQEKSDTPPAQSNAAASPPSAEEGVKRPTPVRLAMETGDAENGGEGDEVRTVRNPDDGREWIVRVSGRSAGGVLPLRTIPLLELTFFHADDPHQPLRRALCQGEGLESLQDEELISGLGASSPVSGPKEDSDEGSPGRKEKKGAEKRLR